MRNLKKVLSLALALVMLLGMMVVGAGAATSFKDDDKIQNKEAVAVLVGMGIMKGREDGSNFEPAGTLTRAEAAKMIAQLDLGVDAADALVGNGTSPFSDVWSGYWAEGAIDYCVEQGYITGDGNGHFFPGRNVSSVEFGIMLLRLLGYDAKIEGLVGNEWASKGAALARKAGLTTSVAANTQAMTRDAMAQMAFNALTASTVEYEGMDITIGDVAINARAKVRTHTGSSSLGVSNTTYNYEPIQANITPIRLCEERFPNLKLGTDEDVFGRVESVWKWKNVNIAGSEKVVAANFEFHEKKSSVSLNGATGDGNTQIYINGKLESAAGKAINADFVAGKTANGRLVQVYLNDNNHKDIDKIVVVDTYVARVSAVSSANETTTVATMSAPSSLKSRTVKVTGFSTGDIVSYTAAWDGKTYEIQADDVTALTNPVTGTLTKWTGSSVETTDKGGSQANFTIDDGDPYQYSVNKVIRESDGSDAEISAFTAKKSELQVYLDKYGFAIYVVGVESEKNYAAVIGVGGTNAYGSETKGVTLLLPDSTTVEATAKLAGNAKWETLKGITENGSTVDKWDGNTYKNLVTDGVADIVTYTVDSKGVYTLTLVEHPAKNNTTKTGSYVKNTEAASSNGYTFVNGKSAMTMPGQPDFYTTSKTIFMVATNDANGNKTYGVYTGYANAPSIKANSGTTVKGVSYALNSTYHNQIDVVYIDATTVDGATAANTYFVKSASPYVYTDSTGKYFVLPAIIDGEVTTIKIDAGLVQNWDGKGDKALIDAPAGVYTIESVRKNDDDIVTSCAVKTERNAFRATDGKKVGTRAANSEVLGWGSAAPYTFYAYNDSTHVFYVDKDYKAISAMAVTDVQTDGNDLIFADYDSGTSKKLTSVVIVEQPETADTTPTEPGNTETTIGNITVVTPDAWGATEVNARIVNRKINVSFKVSENVAALATPQGTVNSHGFVIETAKNATASLPNVTYVTANTDYTTDENYTVVFTGTVSRWKVTWNGVSDAAKATSSATLTATAATNVPVLKMATADLANFYNKASFNFKIEGIDLTEPTLAANTAKGVVFDKATGTGTVTAVPKGTLTGATGLDLFTAGVKATGPVTVTISELKNASDKIAVNFKLDPASAAYATQSAVYSAEVNENDTTIATGTDLTAMNFALNSLVTKVDISYTVTGENNTSNKLTNVTNLASVTNRSIKIPAAQTGHSYDVIVTITPVEITRNDIVVVGFEGDQTVKFDKDGKSIASEKLAVDGAAGADTGHYYIVPMAGCTVKGGHLLGTAASGEITLAAGDITVDPTDLLDTTKPIILKATEVFKIKGVSALTAGGTNVGAYSVETTAPTAANTGKIVVVGTDADAGYFYVERTATLTVTVTWTGTDITSAKDTVTVSVTNTAGTIATETHNFTAGSYNPDATTNAFSTTVTTFVNDGDLAVDGAHS